MKNLFKVVMCHFNLYKKNVLVIQGYFPFDNKDGYELKIKIDGKEKEFDLSTNSSNEVRRRYVATHENVSEEMLLAVDLGEGIDTIKRLCLVNVLNGQEEEVFSLTAGELKKLNNKYNYNFDSSVINDNRVRLIGWTASAYPEDFKLYDGKDEIPFSVKRNFRKDVIAFFQELPADAEPGFEIEFEKKDYKKLRLVATTKEGSNELAINTEAALKGENPNRKASVVKRVYKKLKDGAFYESLKKTVKGRGEETQSAYMKFVEKYGVTAEELEQQRKTSFENAPLMSFVVPMYKTPTKYLFELIDSIEAQTYGNWELCLADGSPDDELGKIIEEKYKDSRIIYKHLENNGGIADNTNQGMEMAKGDFIVLSDHDDTLAPDALFEVVKAINEDKDIDVIYSDEDKVSMEGDIFFDPSFKPDFNIDYLRSTNYICHLFVFKREIYEKAGAFRKEFDGAQDHDFILRCVEVAKKVHHVPKVLYHWRCHIDSTAMNLESKLYALENGARAVEEHYKRVGIPATVKRDEFYGTYKTTYHWGREPLVSIIIPTKDHIEDLKKCIDSIDEKNTYKNIEFIIVENNSTEEETFAYYKELEKRKDTSVVYYEGGFNFSAINNFGIQSAKGELLLLLNNDTEIINPDCIKEMVDVCLREDVGLCGALLYYPDDTIQHAGIVMGIGGIAGHAFVGLERSQPGYMYRAAVTQDMTGVTAACLMIKRSVFDEVGGFTEELAVAFNDVDLCLKVRRAGYLCVLNPHAELYHYESKSRGYEDSAEKQLRFNNEVEKLESLWPEVLKYGDMYYNTNLSLVDGMYKLKD